MASLGNKSIAEMRKLLSVLNVQNEVQSASPSKYSAKQREVKLQAILKVLESGKHVQNRQLMTWLTKDEYEQLKGMWDEQKELRNYIKNKPLEVTEYESLLKRAIFLENRANSYGSKANVKTATKLGNEAQAQYEKALEYLQENITPNYELATWFDRSLVFSPSTIPSLTASAMPRFFTTRSLDKNGNGWLVAKMSKMEVKIDVVERALDNL